jgi:hypothetical protein
MLTYTTLEGQVLDLTGINEHERAYLEGCVAAYRAGIPWETFTELAEGNGNPLVRAAGGRVTQAVWNHPLFQTVYDLEARLGIAQGFLAPEPGVDMNRDPFADAWVPAVEAARRKGVSLSGLHAAIERGEVIARPARAGGTRLVVSANSLARWTPSPVRQAAGRQRALTRADSQPFSAAGRADGPPGGNSLAAPRRAADRLPPRRLGATSRPNRENAGK